MQLSLVLLVIGESVLIQLLAVTLYRWRNTWRYRKRVVATIKQIQVWLDGWYVAAVWTDTLTGRSYTFYSQRIECSFNQRVGDPVIVHVDPNNYERGRILL